MIKRIFLIALTTSVLTNPSRAAFTAKEKSINFTAETLPQNSSEISFLDFSHGITDRFMISVPTLPMLVGYLAVGAKYRIPLSDKLSISPMGSLGADLSQKKNHMSATAMINGTLKIDNDTEAFSFGLGATNPSSSYSSSEGLVRKAEWTYVAFLNYDWYTSGGNLWYAGIANLVPYGGFTWAWEHVHFGLGLAAYIPYANLYWRF